MLRTHKQAVVWWSTLKGRRVPVLALIPPFGLKHPPFLPYLAPSKIYTPGQMVLFGAN